MMVEENKKSIGMNENVCNALQYSTYSTQEKNSQIQIRALKSYHEKFMDYCRRANMTAGNFYKNAGILYMQVNPIDGAIIVVEKSNNNRRSLKNRTANITCIYELNEVLPPLRKADKEGYDIHQKLLKRTIQALDKSDKIQNKSDELISLIEEALSYIE